MAKFQPGDIVEVLPDRQRGTVWRVDYGNFYIPMVYVKFPDDCDPGGLSPIWEKALTLVKRGTISEAEQCANYYSALTGEP